MFADMYFFIFIRVPNALPGKDSLELMISGMDGVPEDDPRFGGPDVDTRTPIPYLFNLIVLFFTSNYLCFS